MVNLFSFPALGYQRVVAWYMSTNSFREFSSYELIPKAERAPNIVLDQSHVAVCECYLPKSDTDDEYKGVCEKIFQMMQGEVWSPNGEARTLIGELNTSHTSMSTGDIIQVGERFFMVSMIGFREVTEKIQLTKNPQ